jgi:UDP-N-acetylmuramyl pentapeptide synthase
MKSIFKLILRYYLKLITKLVLVIHRPKIIVVAGSVNKAFVRDEIKKVLEKAGPVKSTGVDHGVNLVKSATADHGVNKKVRANPRNFNTDIGLPLAILNISSGYGSYGDWWPVIGKAGRAIFQKNFPEYLVLELGVSQTGDMRYLLSIVAPEISVVTDITQRYLESFPCMDDLVAEYIYLAKKTKKTGVVILNHDNLRARELAKKASAPVRYFGETCDEKKDWQIREIKKTATGQLVEIKHQEKTTEFSIPRFGRHHAFALAASLAVEEIIKNTEDRVCLVSNLSNNAKCKSHLAYRQAGKSK